MSDYKIDISLSSPIFQKTTGSTNMIMLDALLARIALERKGIRKTSVELLPENLIFANLPIERVEKCYLCSGHFATHSVYSKPDFFAKRATDSQSVRAVSPFFHSTGAVSHPALIPHYAVATKGITFYVRVMDSRKDEFFDLLKDVKLYGIGPKTSIGYGQVAGLQIVVNKTQPDLCYKTAEGIPTRPLPISLFKNEFQGRSDVPTGMSNYFAPYWFRKNNVPCYLPKPEQYTGLEKFNVDIMKDVRSELVKKVLEKKEKKQKRA